MNFPWYLSVLGAILAVLVLARILGLDGHSSRLSVSERADHVVVRWSGNVERPMFQEISTAFERLTGDPRPLVLVLGSLGGSVQEGGRVIDLVRRMQRSRRVDTHVDTHCGSMCVPIFLAGSRRTASPKANFMFHEVRFRDRDALQRKLRELDFDPTDAKHVEQVRVAMATDELFRAYFDAPRVNRTWLATIRKAIVGTDVWLNAAQLFREGSGVVDDLIDAR